MEGEFDISARALSIRREVLHFVARHADADADRCIIYPIDMTEVMMTDGLVLRRIEDPVMHALLMDALGALAAKAYVAIEAGEVSIRDRRSLESRA